MPTPDELTKDTLLTGGSFTFNVPLPPGTPMSSTVLGSNSTIFLGNRVQVGVEGSPSARSVIANAGTGTFTAQTDVVMQDDIWSRGNVVFLADRVSVAGGVTTAGTLTRQSNVTIGGPILEHQSLTAVPTSWTVTFPSSSTNVQLQPGQTRTLAPGGYATVSVATNATLTLSTGTYFFDQLSNEPSGKIVFTGSGPFTLYVRTSFMAKGPIQLPAATVPPTLLVGVAGTNDVFLQTQFDGTLVAPNANVTLAQIGAGIYHGAFFGKSLTLQADAKVLHRSNGAGAVTPVAECVIPQATGGYKAVFGYSNSSLLGSVTIPLGTNNQFDPAPASRGQPQVFSSGRRRAQFAVPFDGKALAWTLDGASTTANAGLPQCTAACVQHLTDPTKPRIDTVLTTGAPPLSVAESSAIRDSFRWDDTLPLPETFANGDPRLYYALVYVTSRETLQTMDFLRIHYSASPLFESEMVSLEAQGISEQFSYPFDGKGQFVYAFIPGAVLNAIRAAALDPVEPVEIIHVSSFRPIPATDTGFAAQSSCGLQPVTQCVAQAANGSLRAVFSYTNPSGNPVTVPVGSANTVTGGPAGTLPPEAFAAGTHTAVFAVAIATGATVRWTLNGTTVSANAQTARCSAATVAQIGVDSFNPFPPAATPSCRFATPAETQFPSSRLPPAARANTCASLSYQYLGTLGMKWRGVDSDADDAPYQAAVAAFALGDAPTSMATVQGGTTTVQSALFGKLFRKIVQGAGSIVNGAIDGVRRGLNGVAGFFVGKTRVTVIIDPRNTDSNFGTGTPMQQPFGAGFRQASSLQGMELRASKSVFLSLDKLDATNTGRVDVLNVGGNARICFKAENGAAKIVSPFLPVEFCPGRSISTSTPVTLSITMPTLNVMAQFTDAQHYMTRVGKFTPSQAEVLAGGFADTFGLLQGLGGSQNRDRAFTPCWSFSWANDFGIFLTILGAVSAEHLNDYALDHLVGWLVMLEDAAKKYLPIIIENAGKLHVLTDPFTGTPQETQAMRASALYDTATTKAQNASNQITLMKQDADDVQNGVATAANLQSSGSSRAGAARTQAQGAIDQLSARQPGTQQAVQDAKDAFDDAAAAIDDLIHALPANANVIPALQALKDQATNEAEQFNTWLGEIKTAALKVEKVAAAGAGAIVGAALGLTLGQIFQFLAGGDIILPASGGNTNFVDRGIMTHEYGHFALCNLLNSVSSSKFALAYDEAAAEGFITGQSPSATPAVLNEAFADFITSQVIGGTNYARPQSNQILTTGQTESYCLAAGIAPGTGCIDDNATNLSPVLPNSTAFERNVRRYVGLFVDAFDGGQVTPVSDSPFNGNAWQGAAGSLTLAAAPGGSTNDDVVVLSNLQGHVPLRSWISHTFNRGTFLREDNMFGGLSDAMIDNGDNWCARCGVFRLHTQDQMSNFFCPQEWVGPPPTFDIGSGTQTLACTFDGMCPAGTAPNPSTQACEPTCPNPATEHFDPFLLECITTIIVE